MKYLGGLSRHAAWLIVLLIGAAMIPDVAFGGDPPCDFSDEFYRQNGLDPAALLKRVTGNDGVSVIDPSRCTDSS